MSNSLRKARLFWGNYDFEYRLGSRPIREISKTLKKLNWQLVLSQLPLTSPGDFLWIPPHPEHAEPYLSPEWEAVLTARSVQPVWEVSQLPRSVELELVPWGWTAELIEWANQQGWTSQAPEMSIVSWANSRATSFFYEEASGTLPTRATCIKSWEEWEEHLAQNTPEDRWVVKAEFSMSSRERILGQGSELNPGNRNWLQKRFRQQEPVFYEPWLARIAEVSFHYHISPEGTVQFLGIMQLNTDLWGRYQGNSILAGEAALEWDFSAQQTRLLAENMARVGYFGPLSIDCMQYLSENGKKKQRPLQDVNARYTMGRCAWEEVQKSFSNS